MKWSIGLKIACMNAVSIFALISLNLSDYYSTNKMLDATNWRQHSYDVKVHINSLLVALVDAETGQRGYLIVKQDRYLDPYHSAETTIPIEFNTLKTLTTDNESQQHQLDLLAPLITKKLDNIKRSVSNTTIDPTQKLAEMDEGKRVMDEIRHVLDVMGSNEAKLLNQRINIANNSINIMFSILIYGSLFAIIFLILVGIMITRNISKPLQAMTAAAKLLNTSVSEIFTAISQLVSAGSETAVAVSETTSTIEEVKQTSNLTHEKAKAVSENAQQVAQISQTGKASIQETNENMVHIQSRMESIAESMMQLSEQTQAISSIIETVDDLAQQSNLLAVNASIEAEKAGEQGKGFRIVAQEIKNLATQSKQATHRVREILSDVQKATSMAVMETEEGHKVVNFGVKKSEETEESISKLSNSISEAAHAAIQIAASSQQQLLGIEQAAIAMGNIKQASATNVDISKQLEVAGNNLKELALKLEGLIDKYKI